MQAPLTIERATADDLPAIADLAAVVWRAHYPGIIPDAQIDYMLSRMYDIGVMRREHDAGMAYFRCCAGSELIGFAACGKHDEAGVFKLHKLYVHPSRQGQGIGTRLLNAAKDFAMEQGAHALILNVNKRNLAAIAAYQRRGFTVRESVVLDIGGGFAMDDYVMECRLRAK